MDRNQRIVTAGLTASELARYRNYQLIECSSVENIGAELRRDDIVIIQEADVERIKIDVHKRIAMNQCELRFAH